MNRSVVFLLLTGCSGAFSSLPPSEDAGSDSDEASTRDVREAEVEAGEAAACTPFAPDYTYTCENAHDSLIVPEPSQYCLSTGPDGDTSTLTQVPTPLACQCQETFNCTCITSHSQSFPCESPTCNEGVIAGMPVLILGCP
jgi:hypothetical protein